MKTYQLYVIIAMMYLTQSVKDQVMLLALGVFWSFLAAAMYFIESKK